MKQQLFPLIIDYSNIQLYHRLRTNASFDWNRTFTPIRWVEKYKKGLYYLYYTPKNVFAGIWFRKQGIKFISQGKNLANWPGSSLIYVLYKGIVTYLLASSFFVMTSFFLRDFGKP